MNIAKVLDAVLGEHTSSSRAGEYTYQCPKCRDGKFKLAINIKTCRYQCWICGLAGAPKEGENPFKSIVRLFYKIDRKSEAVDLLKNMGSYTSEDITSIMRLLSHEIEKDELVIIPDGYEKLYHRKQLPYYTAGYKYLRNRGITDNDMLLYDVRYNISEQRVLFPSYSRDLKLNYYVTRVIYPTDSYAYDNPTISRNKIIFNEHLVDWNSVVYIVEGVFDHILCRRNSIPLLGSSLNRNAKLLLNRIIENNTQVIISLDPDAYDKQLRICRNLLRQNIEAMHINFGKEKRDIAEMGSDIFAKYAYNNVEKYSRYDDFVGYIKGELN